MTSVDRIQGLSGGIAIKVPCRVATTANITLSGEQTIDGIAVVDGDRVLVKDQTTGSENGIYECSTGTWTRAPDFDGSNDVVNGSLVYVGAGTVSADLLYRLVGTNPITPGTTSITFTGSVAFTTISAFIATMLDDANAAAARTTLAARGEADDVTLAAGKNIVFEGTTADAFETTLSGGEPTADRTLTLPDGSGTLAIDTGTVWLNVAMKNGYIDWATSGNALTAAVKTLAGTDPTASDPVTVAFRDPTLTNGGYYLRTITAALSVVASSGSTLGTVSAQASRIRAVLMDNGGTVVLGLYNPWADSTKSLVGLNEGAVYSSTAEGGAGAADSAQVIYTTAAQTSKAIREVGYMDSTQTTAGTWAQALTNKVQITASTPKTGSVVQRVRSATGAVATGTTLIPVDDTIPQNTEGDQYMSQAITPSSASNKLLIEAQAFLTPSVGGNITCAIFQDSIANALAASLIYLGASGPGTHSTSHSMIANTISSATFKVRLGSNNAGTNTLNGMSSARLFAGVANSHLTVMEISL